MNEKQVMDKRHVELSKQGFRLFRNNVGKAWTGDSTYLTETVTVTLNKGDVVVRRARRIHFGLLVGSGDLIGYKLVKITADMVGKVFAQFASVEQKVKGRKRTKDQIVWHDGVNNNGGVSILLED